MLLTKVEVRDATKYPTMNRKAPEQRIHISRTGLKLCS